jgi:hypothetical protein
MTDLEVTIERLERAIKTTARVIERHMLQLMPTLRRLEAERDKLIRDGDPFTYVRRLLGKDAA